jgi:pyridinium-3,5-bisthiocarboxylic acid mononucleotide nickel chelatase
MAILFCDCFSGISGDMFLGALVDAGLPVEYLADQYRKIHLHEFEGVRAQKVHKGALVATFIRLEFHDHEDAHTHHHTADHADEGQHSHHSHHRHLSDICTLIQTSELSERVKRTSLKIFQQLADAEAKVHGTSVEEVHFHEVGAVDSILDIIGAAIGLEYFNIEAVYSSALPLGTGQVYTQHGLLPLPAPATMELIQKAHAPVLPSKATVEMVTPTGAAILAALAEFRQPEMKITHVGIGAGQRDLEWPNVLRIMIGSPVQAATSYWEIETNIDDMNPQVYGYVMAKLFQAGALDVFLTPIFMKKNRPATKLSVIARDEDEAVICDLILRETSTMGLRVKPIKMREAEWEFQSVETCYGTVPVKLKIVKGEIIQATPEFDVCAQLSVQNNVAVMQVIQETEALALAAHKK